MNRLTCLLSIVLAGLISWLVVVDMGRSGTSYHFNNKNDYSDYICVKQRGYVVLSGCGYEVISNIEVSK